jgi:DNA repair protein RecN (Recombination protein N)
MGRARRLLTNLLAGTIAPMLNSLHIRNFALIENLDLVFGSGLNILTGETGAGKSIVIDALGTALGERASSENIRSGAERFLVEAVFSVDANQAQTRTKLTDLSLENEDDPDQLVLARELTKSGKTYCRVNGRLVTVSSLRSIGMDLVDVHGQHEHQSLLSAETHIELLDNWLGSGVKHLKAEIAKEFGEMLSLRREQNLLLAETRERERNLDLYKYQVNEIKGADLSEGELTTLTQERSRLSNAEKLLAVAEETYHNLNDLTQTSLNSSMSSLQRAVDLDPSLSSVLEPICEAASYLEEAVSAIRHYKETLDAEPGRLEEVNERLDVIHALQRKYGETIEEILAYMVETDLKLSSLEDRDQRIFELGSRISRLDTQINTTAQTLSTERRKGGAKFADQIESELRDLGMVQTSFSVSIEPQSLSARGTDHVEFLISPNLGEPLRPLAKIASGGEASRLMLAIKSVLLRSSYVPTMIFDEIDTGVGGRTGRVIADKLEALGKIAQIVCITHLPQIASRPATAHFFIEKSEVGDRTVVNVHNLDTGSREREIARMLGDEESQTVLQHAREMLAASARDDERQTLC